MSNSTHQKIIQKGDKRIGIWLDHSVAHLMEYDSFTIKDSVIMNEQMNNDKMRRIETSEKSVHYKEQQNQLKYYKLIIEHLTKFNNILLFGPTEAKNELHNLLTHDHRFNEIRVEIQTTEKMSRQEEHAHVLNYFSIKQ